MKHRVSVIIPACNEERTIGPLVRKMKGWHRRPEVIVVANGCTDRTAHRAKIAGAKVILVKEKLGQDVGRAIGLSVAKGRILVVLDADFHITVREIEPFVRAVERGVDVALNRYPLSVNHRFHHPTAVAKHALNLFMHRKDLKAASLTAVPHALSRRAVKRIGADEFAVPPVAHALAIQAGLRVEAVSHVPVGVRNRTRHHKHMRQLRRLIIGDCLEAINRIGALRGERAGYTDLKRRRDLLEALAEQQKEPEQWIAATEQGETASESYQALAVIPARNEQATLRAVLHKLQGIGVDNACVVNNGSSDDTAGIAQRRGALVDEFPDALGHDVGRAVACIKHKAKGYLFIDADFPIEKRDLLPFIASLNGVDLALNDLNRLIPAARRVDSVSIVKQFLNMALNRPNLGIASLTAVPHAINAKVIEAIGPSSLAVPPVALVKTVLCGFNVQAVHPVNVIKSNRRRFRLHSRKNGKLLEKLIIGDHFEAICFLQKECGPRVFFPDEVRKREWARKWR